MDVTNEDERAGSTAPLCAARGH